MNRSKIGPKLQESAFCDAHLAPQNNKGTLERSTPVTSDDEKWSKANWLRIGKENT